MGFASGPEADINLPAFVGYKAIIQALVHVVVEVDSGVLG
jgi:hypothetical protein